MPNTQAYAAHSATTPLAPYSFDRRDPRPRDVQIEILFCGVCHSDLHASRSEWEGTVYPLVPGHEIVERVLDSAQRRMPASWRRPEAGQGE
jgi:alcohol dehydrogenase (NADP+)